MPKTSNFSSSSGVYPFHDWQLALLTSILSNKNMEKGVCNGFTNMWIQAVLQGSAEEDTFYKRLEKISNYFDFNKYLREPIVDKTIKFEKKIQSIYKNRVASKNKLPLSEEEQGLTEIQAFCQSLALQQVPYMFSIFPNMVNQNASEIDTLTASKTLEKTHQIVQRISINTLAVTQEELAHLFGKYTENYIVLWNK